MLSVPLEAVPVAVAHLPPDPAAPIVVNPRFATLLRALDLVELPEPLTYAGLLEALLVVADGPAAELSEGVEGRLAALESGREDTFVLRRRGVWAVELSLAPQPGGGGLLAATDRSEAERRDALFADAEQMSRSGAWELDLTTGKIGFSEGAWRVFGPGSEEVMSDLSRWIELVHPEDRAHMQAAVAHSLDTLEPYDTDYRVFSTDGRAVHIAAKGKIVAVEDGKPLRARGIFQDITSIKEAEAKLRASEARFRAIVDNSLDVISLIDPQGLITFLSPSIRDTLGYEVDALLGRSAFEFLHEEDVPRAQQALQRVVASPGQREMVELRFRHADGNWRHIEVIAVSMLDDPAIGAVVINTREVTFRRQSEERLRQAQRMQVVGQLTSGVAHDFNNLLAVVLGNLEMLAMDLPESSELVELAQHAIEAVDRGRSLTQRLLAFSRQQALEPKPVDLNQLVGIVEQMVSRTLDATISVEVTRSAGLWTCEIDAPQLENALLNLCVNARDAMPDGGRLTIETANARFDEEYAAQLEDVPPGQYVMVAVTDTGSGMSPEVCEHAFEPFYSTKRESGRNSGLGLSMVYGFVRQSRGHVRIYSELGEGTTVKIYLPRTEAKASRPPLLEDPRVEPGRGERVLVVEDDPDLLRVVTALLEELRYTVVEVSCGDDAIEVLKRRDDVDVLLTDVVVPGELRGRALAEAALALRPGLRVLFMSGYTENSIIHQGRLDPDVVLLRKPFRKKDLARKLRSVLDGGGS